MEMSIEGRAAKVSAVTGLSTALSICLQVITVPICLRYWGSDIYGSWLALFASFTLIRTVDAGYVGYVGNQLNMLYYEEQHKLRKTLASALWGVAVLGLVQLTLLMLLYGTDSMSLVNNLQQGYAQDRKAVVALSILTVSWILTGSYVGIVHRLLIPAGMMYQAAWWSLGFQVSQFAALMVAALVNLSLLETSFLFASVQACIYLASAVYIKIKLPNFYPWWAGSDRSTGFTDLYRSVPLTASGLLQQGGNSALVMLVSTFLGPIAVAAFTTIRTLCNLWTTLINVLTAPLMPDVVRFYVEGDSRRLLSIHQAHWLFVGSAVNFSILMAYPFIQSIYALWTRNELPLEKPLLCLLLGTVSLAGMSALTVTFLSSINNSRFVIVSAGFKGGVSLFLGALLLPTFGLTGLGIGILSSEASALVVTVEWFLRNELARMGGTEVPLSIFWSWVSSACVLLYLLTEGFDFPLGSLRYSITLGGLMLATFLGWRCLNPELKTRVLSASFAARGITDFAEKTNS